MRLQTSAYRGQAETPPQATPVAPVKFLRLSFKTVVKLASLCLAATGLLLFTRSLYFPLQRSVSVFGFSGQMLRSSLRDPLSIIEKVEDDESVEWALRQTVTSSQYRGMRPSQGIVFIKTFKTGSSTITGVLHSLATAHNLSVPVSRMPRMTRFAPNTEGGRAIIRATPSNLNGVGPPYDIWCNHATFDRFLTDEAVPASRGKIVTILRRPADRMRSTCDFHHCCPSSKSNHSVWDSFVTSEAGRLHFADPNFDCILDQSFLLLKGTSMVRGRRDMSAMEGHYEQILQNLRSEKWLFMVSERMSESLLVFAAEYNLHPLDITFISMKVSSRRNGEVDSTTSRAERLMDDWNPRDKRLHREANEVLDRKLLRLYGSHSGIKVAVERLHRLNTAVNGVCSRILGRNEDENADPDGMQFWCKEKSLDNVDWTLTWLERLGHRNSRNISSS